eukprot:CAMPEP_0173398034 /NCGR_PEP_ID=MMETSP1356-20130122/40307_1 /TAXON_ID=77927 ORGANISM="Hemiselmis virescens, Strain PCC157" /NCGR_SAMPLE_ID=MMETSP1356 /ASSEMBLY_ACC=CAM_ASM_000847 /LENGTH=528 /DNA_ID=CAMNT_0014357443 /DNA_START=144 /DNA_END=1730 /DNA_ORIENTATION=+
MARACALFLCGMVMMAPATAFLAIPVTFPASSMSLSGRLRSQAAGMTVLAGRQELGRRQGGRRSRLAPLLCSESQPSDVKEGEDPNVPGYEVVHKRDETLVVVPISHKLGSKDVECEITSRYMMLSISGVGRLVQGELWAPVDADKSYWEIDSYKAYERCVVVRMAKKLPEEWPFLLKSDYRPDTVTASEGVISREGDISKEDVEKALQLIVTLMRPPDEAPPRKPGPEKGAGQTEKQWYEAVKGAVDDEWKDTGKEMRDAMEQGATPEEVQDLLSLTQEALQSAEGPSDASRAPIAALAFVRHGKTFDAEDDSVDADLGRMLQDEGRVGASQARKWFNTLTRKGTKLGGVCFSSSAGRCLETAFLMESPTPCVLQGIYDGINEPDAREAFAKCGYAPLSTYVRDGYGGVLRKYAERALVELAQGIEAEVEKRRTGGGSGYLGTVSVYGHAVYSASMAMLVAQALKLPKEDLDLVARCNHGEAEGILVTARGTGHCNNDSEKLDEEVDMRTARVLSGVYQTLKATEFM